ncbi:MAG: biotin transporter BioY [Desulfobacula sp.]|jgi:biotin transport system substrate-specific component|uniref:biotin transporter BioY n=1 Tax=Desulfobacula sp. TaxID=2593537 RepID=UPI001D8CD80D|nr:biotin transporter BioY [Desulfobacula sp.]MBT3483833.1 biotin transporter BioY [Desulfobacula sp.]MBT3803021.1 biotin transporter BioY [Desulfobacula sp.]MBT4023466.1 biotin transporter BioY [Desulfobacula sp.]MBT4197069.1 biotin transporter BioY [Desulfobacula sp.]
MNNTNQLKMIVYTSLFVALIAIGAFFVIPIGPVPIVLQNMFILLAAIILGPLWGIACVAIYLLIGFSGLPVFSGGTSGIGRLFGPTGGYLLGYLPCVFVTAVISKNLGKKLHSDIIAMVAGSLIIYAAGVPWLKAVTGMTFEKALVIGMYPFLIGDMLKIIAAAFIAKALRPVIKF